jgi:hypothetical protein
MKTKITFILLVLFTFYKSYSQTDINSYKYIIVPNKFEVFKEADQYRLNSLSKFLFKKYQFTALMKDEQKPEDLINNPCLALNMELLKDSGMFKTKLAIQLRDCKSDIVFTSNEGESRKKKYAVAYNQALRMAFLHLGAVNYKYTPNNTILAYANISKAKEQDKIKQLQQEVEELKSQQVVKTNNVVEKKEVVKVIKDKAANTGIVATTTASDVLYAQKIEHGFQLVDKTPKVLYTIYHSGKKEVFIVKGRDAVIYNTKTGWVISEVKNNTKNVHFNMCV